MKVKGGFLSSIISLSCFFLLWSVSPVFSMEWTELSTTSDGSVLSYDKGSVRTVNTNVYRLWERILYSDPSVRENVKATIFIREINCQDSQHRIISIIDYDATGEKLFSGSNDQADWSAIPPDTPIDALRKAVCPKDEKSSLKKLYRYLFP